MNILCWFGLHDWYIEGCRKGLHLLNVLREGRVRYCMRCPKEQKYDGKEWQDCDLGMIARERYR